MTSGAVESGSPKRRVPCAKVIASALRPGARAPLEGVAAVAAGEGLSGDVDELQTKLDLAQTYIDMEDFENARTLLREVQAEGGLEQRAIARYLAGKLP